MHGGRGRGAAHAPSNGSVRTRMFDDHQSTLIKGSAHGTDRVRDRCGTLFRSPPRPGAPDQGVTGAVTCGTATGDTARSCPGLGRPHPQGRVARTAHHSGRGSHHQHEDTPQTNTATDH